MRQVEGTDPAPNQVDQTPVRRGRAGGLPAHVHHRPGARQWRADPSSAVELFFQYRESVEAMWSLQRRWRAGRPSRYSSLCGTSSTLTGRHADPRHRGRRADEAYRFQLDKLLKVTRHLRLWRWTPRGERLRCRVGR